MQFLSDLDPRIRHTGPIAYIYLVSVTSLAYKPHGQLARLTIFVTPAMNSFNMPQETVI
jgi:hypothetical protein